MLSRHYSMNLCSAFPSFIFLLLFSLCNGQVPLAVYQKAMELGLVSLGSGNDAEFLEIGLRAAYELHDSARTLDVFEAFSGVGGITKSCERAGLCVRAYDRKARHYSEDLCSLPGLIWFFLSLLSLREGALFWAAPQCSSWITMSSACTKRSAENWWLGDTTRTDVKEANFTANVLSSVRLPCIRCD